MYLLIKNYYYNNFNKSLYKKSNIETNIETKRKEPEEERSPKLKSNICKT